MQGLDAIRIRRAILLWIHVAIALILGLMLLDQENINLSSLLIGRRMRGANGLLFALPAIWPYVLSFIVSQSAVPQRNVYLIIYTVLLGITTYASIMVLRVSDSLAGVTTISIVEGVLLLFGALLVTGYARSHEQG